MKTSKVRCALGRGSRLLMVAGMLSVLPLHASRADDPRGGDDRGYRDHREQREHGRAHRMERHRYPDRYPVYVPPPVYYPRHESPGIQLFIPFDIR